MSRVISGLFVMMQTDKPGMLGQHLEHRRVTRNRRSAG